MQNAFAEDAASKVAQLTATAVGKNPTSTNVVKHLQPTPSMAQLLTNEDLEINRNQRQFLGQKLRNDSGLERDRYFNTINSRRHQS